MSSMRTANRDYGFLFHEDDHFFKGASSEELVRVEATPEMNAEKREEFLCISKGLVETVPDRFFSTSGLLSPREMAGAYDVIYYAGDCNGHLIHYRTARGALNLSTSRGALMGEIMMDPFMEPLDIIPYGGRIAFQETCRFPRSVRLLSSSETEEAEQ